MTADVTFAFVVQPLVAATFIAILGLYLGYALVKFVVSLVTGG